MKNKNYQDHEEIITTASGDFACLFRRDVDCSYKATCAKLPPMLAFGATLDDARDNARDDIEAADRARAVVGIRSGIKYPGFAAQLRAGEEFLSKTMHPTSRGSSLHLASPGALYAIEQKRLDSRRS